MLYSIRVSVKIFIILFFICSACSGPAGPGALYLVSTGNGDPDNITIKAYNTIKKSDIIFANEWVIENFPELLKKKEVHDAGFGIFSIYGKTPEEGRNSKRFDYDEKKAQLDNINRIIREAYKKGRIVSVLCNGDPTIYGPNIWYMEEFKDLNPEIITGISAFNSSNAALKKGVAYGSETHSVILTATFGRENEYDGPDSIERLARNRATIAFFTMFMNIEAVVEKLKIHYPHNTPVAIVQHAGYSDREKVIYGTLETISEQLKDGPPPFEYMFYVGDFMDNRR